MAERAYISAGNQSSGMHSSQPPHGVGRLCIQIIIIIHRHHPSDISAATLARECSRARRITPARNRESPHLMSLNLCSKPCAKRHIIHHPTRLDISGASFLVTHDVYPWERPGLHILIEFLPHIRIGRMQLGLRYTSIFTP